MTSETFFNTCILLGGMILFTMSVEWVVTTCVLKHIRFGNTLYILFGIVAVALLAYGLARRGVPEPGDHEQGLYLGGLIVQVSLFGGIAVWLVMQFVSKRIGVWTLALTIGGLFGIGIVTYFILRRLVEPTMIDNDVAFMAMIAAAVIVLPISYIMTRIDNTVFASQSKTWKPEKNMNTYDEKRRERLEKHKRR